MKLEQQVCSLELAKRLKELGVKQESYFSWADWGHETPATYRIFHGSIRTAEPITRIASAFTVAELGEMLPQYILVGPFTHNLEIVRSSVWRFYYGNPSGLLLSECIYFTASSVATEADARAEMHIYLLENGFVLAENLSLS